MDLIIKVADEDVPALKVKAMVWGVSVEQYALKVLEHDLAPEWLRKSWETARQTGIDQLSADEIEAEIVAARKARGGAALPAQRPAVPD